MIVKKNHEGNTVLQKNIIPNSWGLCLSDEQEKNLASCLKKEMHIKCWEPNNIPDIETMEQEQPSLLWLSQCGYEALLNLPNTKTRHLELLPKILFLEQNSSLEYAEQAHENGVMETLRQPFSKKRLHTIINNVMETQEMHHSILCMTKEIMLEREILERKNSVLFFLVNFLTNISNTSSISSILQNAQQSLNILFPVDELSAIVWRQNEENTKIVDFFSPFHEGSSEYLEIQKELLGHARNFLGERYCLSSSMLHMTPAQNNANIEISVHNSKINKNRWSLPIMVGANTIGFLLLSTKLENSLGKDQTLALSSAMSHLGLSIQTVQNMKAIQEQASIDILTKINNRRHFETYIEGELERFERYGQPMAMLMFDIDHFKQINDTYGHQIGDMVLRETADITQKTIRKSDYCARYGGEEFVIILTHTQRDKALTLADRLRTKIAKHKFVDKQKNISISISIGVACLEGQCHVDKNSLIKTADSALYIAKNKGRNRIEEKGFDADKAASNA